MIESVILIFASAAIIKLNNDVRLILYLKFNNYHNSFVFYIQQYYIKLFVQIFLTFIYSVSSNDFSIPLIFKKIVKSNFIL